MSVYPNPGLFVSGYSPSLFSSSASSVDIEPASGHEAVPKGIRCRRVPRYRHSSSGARRDGQQTASSAGGRLCALRAGHLGRRSGARETLFGFEEPGTEVASGTLGRDREGFGGVSVASARLPFRSYARKSHRPSALLPHRGRFDGSLIDGVVGNDGRAGWVDQRLAVFMVGRQCLANSRAGISTWRAAVDMTPITSTSSHPSSEGVASSSNPASEDGASTRS